MFRAIQEPSTKAVLLALLVVLVCGYALPWWDLSARVRVMSDLQTAILENTGSDPLVAYLGPVGMADNPACPGSVDYFLYASSRPMTAITPAFTGALTRLAWERTSAPAHEFHTTGEVWQIRYPYSVPWGYHYEISLMEVQPDRLALLPNEFHGMEPRLRDGQTWYFIEIFSHWGASCLSDAG